jgi:excinuclease UvrABC helicase subunit UvrB
MEQTETVVQQIIRPTGLLDPEVEIRPIMGLNEAVGYQVHLVNGNHSPLTFVSVLGRHYTSL